MPVYNGERFLREAIDSILAQTYRDFELIIVNDGSTDSSKDIIQTYSDNRIKYVENQENIRLIKTLNKGISIAKGKYIARMDADDIATADRLEFQFKMMEKRNLDFSSGSFDEIDESGCIIRERKWIADEMNENEIAIAIGLQNHILHPSVMIKRDVMKKLMYLDSAETLHVEDADLWMRVIKHGYSMCQTRKVLIHYRKSEGNITSRNHDLALANFMELALKWQSEITNFPMTSSQFKLVRYGMAKNDSMTLAVDAMFAFVRYILSAFQNVGNCRKLLVHKWMVAKLFAMIKNSKANLFNKIELFGVLVICQICYMIRWGRGEKSAAKSKLA